MMMTPGLRDDRPAGNAQPPCPGGKHHSPLWPSLSLQVLRHRRNHLPNFPLNLTEINQPWPCGVQNPIALRADCCVSLQILFRLQDLSGRNGKKTVSLCRTNHPVSMSNDNSWYL